jgi:hypothetical protein
MTHITQALCRLSTVIACLNDSIAHSLIPELRALGRPSF